MGHYGSARGGSNVATCIYATLWGPGGEVFQSLATSSISADEQAPVIKASPFPPIQSTQMIRLPSSEPQQEQQGSMSAYQQWRFPCSQCMRLSALLYSTQHSCMEQLRTVSAWPWEKTSFN